MSARIRIEKLDKDSKGEVTYVRLVFGPHHFLEIDTAGNRTTFAVGYTHHGFRADASELNSVLEGIVEEVRQQHPELRVD